MVARNRVALSCLAAGGGEGASRALVTRGEGPLFPRLRAENKGGGMPKGCIFELLVEEGSTGMQGGMWRAGDGVADAAAGTPCLPRHNFVDTQRRKKHM